MNVLSVAELSLNKALLMTRGFGKGLPEIDRDLGVFIPRNVVNESFLIV